MGRRTINEYEYIEHLIQRDKLENFNKSKITYV